MLQWQVRYKFLKVTVLHTAALSNNVKVEQWFYLSLCLQMKQSYNRCLPPLCFLFKCQWPKLEWACLRLPAWMFKNSSITIFFKSAPSVLLLNSESMAVQNGVDCKGLSGTNRSPVSILFPASTVGSLQNIGVTRTLGNWYFCIAKVSNCELSFCSEGPQCRTKQPSLQTSCNAWAFYKINSLQFSGSLWGKGRVSLQLVKQDKQSHLMSIYSLQFVHWPNALNTFLVWCDFAKHYSNTPELLTSEKMSRNQVQNVESHKLEHELWIISTLFLLRQGLIT